MPNVYIDDEMYSAICYAFGHVESDLEGSEDKEFQADAKKCLAHELPFIIKYKKARIRNVAKDALDKTGKEYTKEHYNQMIKELEGEDHLLSQVNRLKSIKDNKIFSNKPKYTETKEFAMNILDIQELKSEEVDEHCDVCIGTYNDEYIVYVDSGDTHIEDSEIFYRGRDKSKANSMYVKTIETLS